MSRPTVALWRRRLAERGPDGMLDEPRPGAPRRITGEQVERAVATTPEAAPGNAIGLPFSLWTAARLADYLAELTGVRMSAPSVCRLLREGGMALSRPQHTISSPDPEYALKKGRSKLPVAA